MKYSYEVFINDLEMGHEIEFIFQGIKYSISRNQNGWHLTKFGSGDYQTFPDIHTLLERGKVSGRSLREIWEYVEVDSIF